jgi:hypothetical protein
MSALATLPNNSPQIQQLVTAVEMALKADLERTRRVRQLLRDQNNALVNARAADASTIAAALDEAATQQESFDALRESAIADLADAVAGIGERPSTLKELVAKLEPNSSAKLTRAIQNLKAVQEDTRTLAARNAGLAENALSLTQDWLRVLTQAILTAGPYGQQSSTNATPSLLLDQRA